MNYNIAMAREMKQKEAKKLLQFCKKWKLDTKIIIILDFGGTNNIFFNCILGKK